MSLLMPTDEDGIRHAVTAAFDAAEPILVRGGGGKGGMLRPVQAARTLSTAACAGITLYSPKELVLSARAGTTIEAITATLAEAGQHLIAEPPDFSALLGGGAATLGGVVGANLSGPRRVAWGAMRDHVLGIRAVNGSGEVFRSGGRVLKNVTGLDLCKLLTGSHGTLAVMTEITLKVLPAPEATASVLISGLDPVRGVAALSAALGSPWSISAAAHLPPESAARMPGLPPGSATLARIEDFSDSTAYRSERLRTLLAAFGAGEILDDATSRAVWRDIRDAKPLPTLPEDAIWRLSLRPSAGSRVALALQERTGARWFLDWGGGLLWLAASADTATHNAICAEAARAGGTWTLMRGPDALRSAVDVIPPEPAPLARIAAEVKRAMDPRAILNPGRLRAGS